MRWRTVFVIVLLLLLIVIAAMVVTPRGWYGYEARQPAETAVLSEIRENDAITTREILGPVSLLALGRRVVRISKSEATCPTSFSSEFEDPAAIGYDAEIQVTTWFGLPLRTIVFECGGLQHRVVG